ncbi:MAG: peptide-methionine (S)-S-oxide reductase MsrA [Alphaproteobacteria bacterium]|nr:peptide-methionine (S)-S-oxide reductase MsrA [Alphaproteobacteria bacterium]
MIARFALALLAALMLNAASFADDYLSPAQADGADLPGGLSHAIVASGCFWCTEKDFEGLDGVIEVVSGFAGGSEANPGYYDVVRGRTGHVESARIIYDPAVVSYEALLEHYWRNVDPFDGDGQFCDRGAAYAPAIFPVDDDQRAAAEASRSAIADRFGRDIAVRIRSFDTFWPAGAEHQDYAVNNPIRYQRYRFGCRRDQRLRQIWGG